MSYDTKKKKFKCFSCGQSYDIFNHYQEYYNKSFLEASKSIVSDFGLNIDININKSDRKAKKEPTKHVNSNNNILSYCEKRSISKATLDYVGVRESGNLIVFEYRNELGEHLANKYRKTKKSNGPKMWFEKDTNVNTLFNMDKVDITKPLLIIEGEMDCLSVIEAGFKNVVSIPSGVNGVNEWITSNWTFIEQFEEVIIWFDNDEAGIKGAREVFNRLPNASVKIVRCEIANDANELLHKFGKLAVLKQIEKASAPAIEGVAGLDEVEDFDIHEAETVKLGIDYIDDKMIGLVFGSLNIITGKSGSGKSTILNQVCIGESIAQGYKTFLASGELTPANVKYWLLQTLANEDQFIECESKYGRKYKKVSPIAKSKIEVDIKDKFFMYTDDNYNIDVLINKMEVLAKRYGFKVFIIDNLMMIRSNIKDKLEADKDTVDKLKKFAKKYNAIVHLVAHPRKSADGENMNKDDVSGNADITNLADYVTIIIRASDEIEEYDAILKVDKNRHTGVSVGKKLMFDIDRKRFYSPETEKELHRNYFGEYEQVNICEWEAI
jgi:twinkle protein